jgi:3-phenylpropionate/cinnamic acid dioxygenase small subunit
MKAEDFGELREDRPSLLEAVQAFLFHENRLLDENRYEEWVDLFSEDGLYWIPSNEFNIDPRTHVCVVYADKARLREVVVRARSGTFWAQEPPSRTSRLVGNILIEERLPDCRVRSKLLVTELRRGRQRHFAGTCRYRLRLLNGEWKIREKLVELIGNDEPLDNFTFMV